MAITFDPVTLRIILDSASVSATEIYSRWVDWAASGDNLKYGMVMRQVGGDDLGGGLSIPPYYFLQGNWRVRPMETSHNLTITGNLFVEGGGVPVVQTIGTYQINVNYTVPVQAQGISTSGSTAPTAEQVAAAILAAAQVTPISASAQNTAGIAESVWTRTLEGAYSAEAMQRILFAALSGKRQGLGTANEQYMGADGTTPRITLAPDANGNGEPIRNGA